MMILVYLSSCAWKTIVSRPLPALTDITPVSWSGSPAKPLHPILASSVILSFPSFVLIAPTQPEIVTMSCPWSVFRVSAPPDPIETMVSPKPKVAICPTQPSPVVMWLSPWIAIIEPTATHAFTS